MGEAQTIELLESYHRFPCSYTFKAIGKVENGFIARVVAAVRDELAFAADPPYHVRQSSGGRHVSVTLEPRMDSAQRVLDVYRRLRNISGVVLLL
jgi:putative lipoic acid-binding regulatory protein